VRTPVGRFQGSLQSFAGPRLGALAVREAVRRAGLAGEQVDECIMGCVLQAGLGQNPARQAAIYGGLSAESGAFTVNQVCGSGLKAVALAAQAIETGNAELVVAGGMESGLWEAYNGFHMGVGAEMIAAKYGISREEQDAFAAESHRRAALAAKEGLFKDEIVPVEVPAAKKGAPATVFDADESIRPDTSVEVLARLKPAFQEGGTVTAGNSPGISDGAAALVVTSADRARALGLKPLAVIRAQSTSGGAPEWFGLAPIEAVRRVAARAGWELDSVDLFELNEAFAVQALAVLRDLKLDPAKVNVHGGAVAIGHPIGASGARVLTTLLYAMERYGKTRGIAALCLGGGNAVGLAVERPPAVGQSALARQ
jgi:acetyl-CoA C-acetyltransferase